MNYVFFIIICICLVILPKVKWREVSIILILLTFLAAIVIYPADAISSARDGLALWLNVVMPSLLPFFIVNDMLIALRVPENISLFLNPLAKLLFNTSGYGAYAFIMSIFAGYPSGAKIVSQLTSDKKITPEEGQKILTFSSTSGPLFIIGAVGTGMLGSSSSGYILFLSHFIGSIINGIFSRLFFKHSIYAKNKNTINHSNVPSKGDLLSESIKTSLYTCGIIGGYIIIFSVIIRILDSISFYKILMSILNLFFNLSNSSSETICAFIKSTFEISNGCRILSQSALNLPLKLILISFIISLSGLSVIGQVSSIITNTGIKLKTYIIFKITHGIFSALTCYILLSVKVSIPVLFSGIFIKANPPYNITFYIVIYLMLMLLLNITSSIFKNIRKQ